MALGSHHLGFCGLVGCEGFVAFLGRHDAFIEETLYTFVGLLGDVSSSLSLLPELVGTLYLFLSCSVVGHFADGFGSVARCFGSAFLSLYFGDFENGERISYVDIIAFLYPYFEDAPGQFA